jgi:NADPH-dependent 2,4-dienoyl-CoA reductase/sulfur reductase-like enzyme
MRTIAVVGGGIAGHEAAWAARRQDPDSRVLLFQEEPHPLYSACILADYVSGEIPREKVFLVEPDEYARAGIEFHPQSPVLGIDLGKRLLLLEKKEVHYDSLVIATGSRPILPPIPGASLKGVCSLKSLADADRLASAFPKRAVVVGAGPVGLECALALAARGSQVYLVELLPRVLPRLLDEPLAGMAKGLLEERGIEVLTGERVLEVQGNMEVEGIKTSSGFLEAEGVILVLGMKPEVQIAVQASLGLGASGGILVDDSMATEGEQVWACGDCVESRDLVNGRTGLHMLWGNAVQQGRAAGRNAAGGKKKFPGALNVTTVRIGEKAVASVGSTQAELQGREVQFLFRKDAWGNGMGVLLHEGRLIGAQVMGPVERIGGILRILLQGGSLGWKPGEGEAGAKAQANVRLWPLRGLEKELARLGFGSGIS